MNIPDPSSPKCFHDDLEGSKIAMSAIQSTQRGPLPPLSVRARSHYSSVNTYELCVNEWRLSENQGNSRDCDPNTTKDTDSIDRSGKFSVLNRRGYKILISISVGPFKPERDQSISFSGSLFENAPPPGQDRVDIYPLFSHTPDHQSPLSYLCLVMNRIPRHA